MALNNLRTNQFIRPSQRDNGMNNNANTGSPNQNTYIPRAGGALTTTQQNNEAQSNTSNTWLFVTVAIVVLLAGVGIGFIFFKK